MDPLLEQFLNEARENLSYLDRNLEKLADGDYEEINALFRAAHTLKGGAGLVGLDGVKTITHHAEDLLDALRNNKIEFSDEMLDVLYEAFDEVVEQIDAAEESGEIPEVDSEVIEKISKDIQAVMGKESENDSNDSLDTELNIVLENDEIIGNLISNKNLDKFVANLELDLPEIDNNFLLDDNYYLLDLDLDTQTCEFGNDPVYLMFLLDSDNVLSVTTFVPSECDQDLMTWDIRLCVVVKSNKDLLEDSLYNIIDEVKVYPLSLKMLFSNNYESCNDDIFNEFLDDFKQILDSGDYSELNEKISAVIKVINPDSKEGFILARLNAILPNLEFESINYLEVVKYVASLFNINDIADDKVVENTQSESNDKEENNIDDAKTTNLDNVEIDRNSKEVLNAINLLKNQLKVLDFSNDDAALSRVKIFVTRALEFLNIQCHFHVDDSKSVVKNKIMEYIAFLEGKDKVQQTKEELHKEQVNEKQVNEKQVNEKQQEVIKATDKSNKKDNKREKKAESHNAVPKTIKIDQSEIDDMMDIIGELLVMKNALPYIANKMRSDTIELARSELNAKYDEISRIVEMLQDKIMGMRLLPMSYIFSRYPKLIRDISRKLNKKIKYLEEGGETKLDKMMIEKIADPLVHIIRNSLDHGIEATEEDRTKVGKDPVGTIKISAKSVGDKVHIIIEDDGRGIDVEKVIFKALSQGIIDEDDINSMSYEEKLMLIFHPGLSTKDEVSELSGRGVGTDAVKSIVEELGGKIFLWSQKGQGTKTTIELPISVALTNVFHVIMNNNHYAIAMEHIVETIKVKKDDLQIANRKPFIRLRDEIIPMIIEPTLLPEDRIDNDEFWVVVIQGKELRFGLVVDEFVNQLDVVQKPLAGILQNHPLITGTSLLGNGDILFIIDPNKIITN